MEELTLHEQMVQLQKDKDHHYESLNAVTNALDELTKQEKQRNLPRINRSDFDKLLSLIEECIIDNRIDVGSNCDVFYSIDDNEISADITLNDHFAREVLTDLTNTVEEGHFLVIIEDMEKSITTVEKVF